MKILVIDQHFYPEQFQINDICFTLAGMGHDITVLTGLPNYPSGKIARGYRWFRRRRETVNGVRVLRVPIVSRGRGFVRLSINYLSFALTAALAVLFIRKDFDVVFVYQTSPVTMALPAVLYRCLTGKKVLLYCLDIWPESVAVAGIGHSSPVYKVLFALSRWIYRRADRILVTSKSYLDYFRRVLGLETDLAYLPQYAEGLFATSAAATGGTSGAGETRLVFAGNIGHAQSVQTIIRAAAELGDLGDAVRWEIIGDGSARAECEALARALGLQDRVAFCGQKPITEMPGHLARATALVVTLCANEFISYTLPGKVQAYMAAGRPILGAIGGEAREVIEEAGCGLVCPAEDYKGLAGIVRRFVRETDRHRTYGENARRYYERHFTKQNFIRELLNCLDNLQKE